MSTNHRNRFIFVVLLSVFSHITVVVRHQTIKQHIIADGDNYVTEWEILNVAIIVHMHTKTKLVFMHKDK